MKLTVGEIVHATDGVLRRGSEERVIERIAVDSRVVESGDLFIALVGQTFDGHDFLSDAAAKGAVGAIVSREVETSAADLPVLIAVADTTAALTALASHVRRKVAIPVVGITGSNGKTSTKELAAGVLGENVLKAEASFNNRIGVSRTLLRLEPHHRVTVLEIGTNHFGEVAELVEIARPTIGVFLNVQAVHTEFLQNEEGVAREKSALPLSTEYAVLNADDPRVIRLADQCGKVIRFGFGADADVCAENVHTGHDGRPTFDLRIHGERIGRVTLQLLGLHQISNALAAAAVGALLDVPPADIANRLRTVPPPKMRVERVQIGGVTLYNDAYNANPASVRAAFEFFRSLDVTGERWVVLGEMLELGAEAEAQHRRIARELSPEWCDAFVAVGVFADVMAQGAKDVGIGAVLRCSSVEEVGLTLAGMLRPGDYVLLKASRRVQLERAISAYQYAVDSAPHSPRA